MRIAFFHELPKTTGSRKAVDKIAEYFSRKNTVDLFYVDKERSYPASKYIRKTFFYKFTPVEWSGGNPSVRLYRDTIELIKLFILHLKIAKALKKKKYDAVFIHGSHLTESPFVLLFGGFFKIYYAHAPNYTLIFEKVMGMPKKDRFRYIYELVNRFTRRMIDRANVRRSDLILANSYYTKQKISDFYGKKSSVSYLGVDTSVFKPAKKRKKYDYLFVGSYHTVDGYNLLHQTVQSMKKIKGKILAIEDEWISSDKQMAALYNSARVVLCLSHGEPFGLVAIEAMSCGVPVIAVNEAGYKETVIHNKTGILIKRSQADLKKALQRILSDENLRLKFSKNSRLEAVKKWSWRVRANDMENLIARRINKHER